MTEYEELRFSGEQGGMLRPLVNLSKDESSEEERKWHYSLQRVE